MLTNLIYFLISFTLFFSSIRVLFFFFPFLTLMHAFSFIRIPSVHIISIKLQRLIWKIRFFFIIEKLSFLFCILQNIWFLYYVFFWNNFVNQMQPAAILNAIKSNYFSKRIVKRICIRLLLIVNRIFAYIFD